MSEERLTAKVILSNLEKHRFDVGDYKMCSTEAEIVKAALNDYLDNLTFDEELKVIGDGVTV